MGYDDSLAGVALLERDRTGHVLLAWIYPNLEQAHEAIIDKHCGLREAVQPRFIWLKNGQTWIYFLTIPNTNEDELAPVEAFTIALLAKSFNPEKYKVLTQVLASVYSIKGSPPDLLKVYLEVFTKGTFDGSVLEVDSFNSSDFDPRRALLVTSITDLISMFGKEIILVWTAMMMKKKVIVFSENPRNILRVIRGLPIFVWHRQDWNMLRPLVDLQHSVEIADLKAAGVYVAGVYDPAGKNKTDFYDVLVDVDARSISVADHAKSEFMLTPFQRDLAEFLVQASEDESINDQAVIKQMVQKTRSLLQKIESLKGDEALLTPEKLNDANLPSQMANFVFSIAAAEGMTKVTG